MSQLPALPPSITPHGNKLLIKRTALDQVHSLFSSPGKIHATTKTPQQSLDQYSSIRQEAGGLGYDLRRVLSGRQPIIAKPLGETWPVELGDQPELTSHVNENSPLKPHMTAASQPVNYVVHNKMPGLNLDGFLQRLYQDDVTETVRQQWLTRLSRQILRELLELHRDHAHGDFKPENILIEFSGDISDLLTAADPDYQVTLIDFDNARPNESCLAYPGNKGGTGSFWHLSGKTSQEKDLAAFCHIIRAMHHQGSRGNYHESGLFTTEDTYAPDTIAALTAQVIDDPMLTLITAIDAGELTSRKAIIDFCRDNGIFNAATCNQLLQIEYLVTVRLDPGTAELAAAELATRRVVLAEMRRARLAAVTALRGDDEVYNEPLLLLDPDNPTPYIDKLPEQLHKTVRDAIADEDAAYRNRLSEREGGGGAPAEPQTTPAPRRSRSMFTPASPQQFSAAGNGGSGAAPSDNDVVGIAVDDTHQRSASTELPVEEPKEKFGPWAVTGITAASFFGAGVIAVGIAATVAWKVTAAITFSAIATACWPVAVAAAGILVLATALAAIIAHCKRARRQQQAATAADTATTGNRSRGPSARIDPINSTRPPSRSYAKSLAEIQRQTTGTDTNRQRSLTSFTAQSRDLLKAMKATKKTAAAADSVDIQFV